MIVIDEGEGEHIVHKYTYNKYYCKYVYAGLHLFSLCKWGDHSALEMVSCRNGCCMMIWWDGTGRSMRLMVSLKNDQTKAALVIDFEKGL